VELIVQIERIENGYIVTDGEDTRVFYGSLEEFAQARIVEPLRETDRRIVHHERPDHPFRLSLIGNFDLA
jgi:hypothetical protein